MLLGFPITWIAEKVDALPQILRIFHNSLDYWLMLVFLLICAFAPAMSVFKKSERTQV